MTAICSVVEGNWNGATAGRVSSLRDDEVVSNTLRDLSGHFEIVPVGAKRRWVREPEREHSIGDSSKKCPIDPLGVSFGSFSAHILVRLRIMTHKSYLELFISVAN